MEDIVDGVYRKVERIVDHLRSDIVDGKYEPNEQLPSRQTLSKRYNVSIVTIQRVFDRLKEEGFTVSVERQGTFVAENGPHLSRYALIFPGCPGEDLNNQFFAALANEAADYRDGATVDLHYGFEGHEGMERYRKLVDDVGDGRLAGLIFVTPPSTILDSPLFQQADVPRAAFMTPLPDLSLPVVTTNKASFLKKVNEELREFECERVGAIVSTNQGMDVIRQTQESLEAAGIPVIDRWFQMASISAPECAKPLVRLLMHRQNTDRPNALIVMDDNLLWPVSRALKEMGIDSYDDFHLVSHCNFPWPTPSAMSVVRIGYCMKECLHKLMEQIDYQREGKPVSPVTRLKAYNEQEYAHAVHEPQWVPLHPQLEQ